MRDDTPPDVIALKLTIERPLGLDAHPDRMEGRLCLQGSRIPVAQLLHALADGWTVERWVEERGLSVDRARAALMGVAELIDP